MGSGATQGKTSAWRPPGFWSSNGDTHWFKNPQRNPDLGCGQPRMRDFLFSVDRPQRMSAWSLHRHGEMLMTAPEPRIRDHPDFQSAVDRLLLDARYLEGFDTTHRVGRTWKDTAADLALVLGAPSIPATLLDAGWVPQPAPADAKITMSPDTVQNGDRVRLVIEGPVGTSLGDWDGFTRTFIQRVAEKFGDGVTIELLERPEKPLAVGDPVVLPPTDIEDDHGPKGHIRFIEDGYATVRLEDGRHTVASVCTLSRAPIA